MTKRETPSGTVASSRVLELTRRVQSEYEEMPGLSLTAPRAFRFLGLDKETGTAVLAMLVERGFLKQTDDGRYICARN
ncbi:MAG: hypothetical protein ACRD2N_00485 [Vicinamibacterales bacterium]